MPVGLTTKGLKTARAAFVEDMQLEAELLRGLSKKEQDTLAALLGKLARSLEDADG